MDKQGNFVHTYTDDYRLVPLGHWNWKWNDARSKYDTYQRELLSGVLTLSSQFRIVASLPIIWLCDNQAVKTFIDSAPPSNARLRRWYVFLAQLRSTIKHVPGQLNEFCDYLSRNAFEDDSGLEIEKLAKEAFVRMDSQLDLSIQALLRITVPIEFQEDDFVSSEFSEVWKYLEPFQANLVSERLWFRTDRQLLCERKMAVP